MAACRLAAKGRSLADASYEAEVASIQAFLQMQHPAPVPAINPASLDITPEDYVAPRYAKKLKGKVCECFLFVSEILSASLQKSSPTKHILTFVVHKISFNQFIFSIMNSFRL